MIAPKEYLQKESKAIDEALSEISFDDSTITDMFRYAVATGRRLRGALVLISAKAVGGNPTEVVPAAAAVELLHKSTLIHDDIIDESGVRRGKKAFHVVYGSSKGVIMGDLLCARAFDYLQRLEGMGDLRSLEAHGILADALNAIYEGQHMDLAFEGGFRGNEDEFFEMLTLKSARLIEASAMLGATLGGGRDEEIKALASYAKNLAIAFQIQNDINNLTGAERKLGIKKAADLYQGKCSLPILHALRRAEKDKKDRIYSTLAMKNPSKREVSELIRALEEQGSFDYARNHVERFLGKSRRSLRNLRDSKTKEFLSQLAVPTTHSWYW